VAAVARRLGIDARGREDLVFASLLHDVGKVGISGRILRKPGPLTPAERAAVERHPRLGASLVSHVPELAEFAPAVLHHHERWDGDGYPAQLRGEAIPLEARLIGVADAFAAMLADRPYRPARSLEEACAELERCAGTQFDPTVVPVFLETLEA
jgi:HD-GYP domain-containing protein (c-di-GMP phosphodiesterase class II)